MIWQESSRDRAVDITRSIAIITMVLANMGPVLSEPHSITFRLLGSFAAPLFIILAGMMVDLTSRTKSYSFQHYLLRGALILSVGIGIDAICWRIYPFTTVDILYLIGIAIPIAYFLSRLPSQAILIVSIGIFIITPLLQYALGYTYYPTEYYLSGDLTVAVEKQTSIIHHWITDGWFPLFPWLGYMTLGVYLAKLRWNPNATKNLFGRKLFLAIGLALLTIGVIMWYLHPGSLFSREGYSEMFYPPTVGYIITSLSVVFLVLYLSNLTQKLKFWSLLTPLGEASLLMYIIHIAIISRIYVENYEELGIKQYLFFYLILLAAMILIAHLIRLVKIKAREMPYILRFFLGS